MYRCFLTNLGYYLEGAFDSLQKAIDHGKTKGFEFTVYKSFVWDLFPEDAEVVASWTVFGGTKYWTEEK